MSSLLEVLEQSKDLGFLGPGPVAPHIEHAEAFIAACTPPPARFLDLGAGGGVPGLVLALRWPESSAVLLDAQLRRVEFLRAALETLGLADRIAAVHGRAEDRAHEPAYRHGFDVVTARSFGPPALTAECGAGFVRTGGVVVVAEPPAAAGRWPAAGLDALGLADEGLVNGPSSSVRRLRAVAIPDGRVPRRLAAMQRSPRF